MAGDFLLQKNRGFTQFLAAKYGMTGENGIIRRQNGNLLRPAGGDYRIHL